MFEAVRVYPTGNPSLATWGVLVQLSDNGQACTIMFEDKPLFWDEWIYSGGFTGMMVSPIGIPFMARVNVETCQWSPVVGTGTYTIEVLDEGAQPVPPGDTAPTA